LQLAREARERPTIVDLTLHRDFGGRGVAKQLDVPHQLLDRLFPAQALLVVCDLTEGTPLAREGLLQLVGVPQRLSVPVHYGNRWRRASGVISLVRGCVKMPLVREGDCGTCLFWIVVSYSFAG